MRGQFLPSSSMWSSKEDREVRAVGKTIWLTVAGHHAEPSSHRILTASPVLQMGTEPRRGCLLPEVIGGAKNQIQGRLFLRTPSFCNGAWAV